MNTLSSTRSVNTFQSGENYHASIANLRYPRPSSMYLPVNDRDNDSRDRLLPSDPFIADRRAQTLGRNTHHAPSVSRNLTNPLFESAGSLDQPWYKSYGAASTLPPPTISLPPNRYQDTSTFATARDFNPTIRVPIPRSPARTSPYSTVRRPNDPSVHSYRPSRPVKQPNLFSCGTSRCCEREPSPYATPADVESVSQWTHQIKKEPPKPWVVCLLTVSTIFDILLLVIVSVIVFFLNCSSESWLYTNNRVHSICINLWSDWIPLYHRTFRCPALPPGYDEASLARAVPMFRQYIERLRPNTYTTPSYGIKPDYLDHPKSPILAESTGGIILGPEVWDADIGLMPPPPMSPVSYDATYGMTTTRLYGPTYERPQSSWLSNQWLRLHPTVPYTSVPSDSIIIGCIIIPLVLIVFIEITSSCLSCCRPRNDRRKHRLGEFRRVIGRLYRFCVTYIFGLLIVLLITLILKPAIGRLRPNFINICRPIPTVCPRWSALLQTTAYSHHSQTRAGELGTDSQMLSFLFQEAARQGFILVPGTTTPSPVIGPGKKDAGFLSDTDCIEKGILRIKYARTSFPSLTASVTMYASIFVSAYVTYTLRYLRRSCFCIPLVLLLATFLANVLLGLGRVVHRENWLEDVLAGWALGAVIAAYILYRILHASRSKEHSLKEVQKQLNHIQNMLQSNNEYKQNEMRLMKYL